MGIAGKTDYLEGVLDEGGAILANERMRRVLFGDRREGYRPQ